MGTEVQYYIVGRGEDDNPYSITGAWSEEAGARIAEECAADFHSNHDGWEHEWPLEIVVLSKGKKLGRFRVEREAVPEFNATEFSATLAKEQQSVRVKEPMWVGYPSTACLLPDVELGKPDPKERV